MINRVYLLMVKFTKQNFKSLDVYMFSIKAGFVGKLKVMRSRVDIKVHKNSLSTRLSLRMMFSVQMKSHNSVTKDTLGDKQSCLKYTFNIFFVNVES